MTQMNFWDNEVWLDIPGYEGFYQVSDQGRVKRLGNSPKCCKDRILKPLDSHGYLHVALSINGNVQSVAVHRLVMWAFVGKQGDLWVNHKNGLKDDNRLANLEYTTPGENTQHAYNMGLNKGPVGELNGLAKLTEDQVYEVRLAFSLCGNDLKRKDVQEYYGISQTCLSDVLADRSWKHV